MPTDLLIADFVVATIEERDFELRRALATAKFEASMDSKLGVLVTRHDFCRFSVSLTTSVPYRTIHERDHTHQIQKRPLPLLRLNHSSKESVPTQLQEDPEAARSDDRKGAEGKRHNQALVALARKRCDILYAMLGDGTCTYRAPAAAA